MIDLRQGDCLEVMRTLPDNSVHACVTDPPYGTCAEKTRYLALLRRVIRMSCLTVERCPAGYRDVAEFLREEEARKV